MRISIAAPPIQPCPRCKVQNQDPVVTLWRTASPIGAGLFCERCGAKVWWLLGRDERPAIVDGPPEPSWSPLT